MQATKSLNGKWPEDVGRSLEGLIVRILLVDALSSCRQAGECGLIKHSVGVRTPHRHVKQQILRRAVEACNREVEAVLIVACPRGSWLQAYWVSLHFRQHILKGQCQYVVSDVTRSIGAAVEEVHLC